MAIGNQLDLQIIVNGYSQAQNALNQLSGSFGQLRDSAVEYSSAVTRYNNIANRQKKQMTDIIDTTEELALGVIKTTDAMESLVGGELDVREEFRDLEDAMQHVTASQAKMTTGIIQTVGQFAQMAVTIGIEVVSSLREASIEMEQLTIQLKTIGAVGEDTTESLRRLVEMAKLPGIDFQQAVSGVTQLRATGISASQAEEAVLQLGNALASVGGDPQDLQGVIRAFTQIQSKGKVYAEEIYQIAERLPQIRKIMLDVIGTADTELLAKEGYSANQFLMMVTEGLGRLPRVADNTRNQLSNLKNEVFLLGSELGKHLMPSLLAFLKGLNNVIASIRGWSEGAKNFAVQTVKWGTVLAGILAITAPFILALSALGMMNGFVALQANVATVATSQQALAQQVQTVTASEATGAEMALAGANTAVATTANVATGAVARMTWSIRALTTTTIVGFLAVLAGVVYAFVNWGNKTAEVKDEFTDLNSEIQKTRDLLAVASDIKRFTLAITEQQRALNNLNKELDLVTEKRRGQTNEEMKKEFDDEQQSLQITADYAKERLQANISLLLAEIQKAGLRWENYAKIMPSGDYVMTIGEKTVDTADDWVEWWDSFGDSLHTDVQKRIKEQNNVIASLRSTATVKQKSMAEDFMYHFEIIDEFYEAFDKDAKKVGQTFKELNDDYTDVLSEKGAFTKFKDVKSTYQHLFDEIINADEILKEESITSDLSKDLKEMDKGVGGAIKDTAFMIDYGKKSWGRLVKIGGVTIMKNATHALEALEEIGAEAVEGAEALGIKLGALESFPLDISKETKSSDSYTKEDRVIKVFVRGQKALTDLYTIVGDFLGGKAGLKFDKQTFEGRQFIKYEKWYQDMTVVLNGQRKAREASNTKLFNTLKDVTQLEGLMKAILQDTQIPLISTSVEKLRLSIQNDMNEEIISWNGIQSALNEVTNDEKTEKLIDEITQSHSGTSAESQKDLLRLEELLHLGRQDANQIKLDSLDDILTLTESGLPEVARVLIDTNLSQAQQANIINKYVDKMFLQDGIFNSKHIKKMGRKIEAEVDTSRIYIEKIAYNDKGKEKTYKLERYSPFKNAGKSLVILIDILTNFTGGAEAQRIALEEILKQDALKNELAIEAMNQASEQKQSILENLKDAMELTPDTLTGKIIQATIDHQTIVNELQSKISVYLKDNDNIGGKFQADIEELIKQERTLFKQRIDNIREANAEQKQMQKDNLQLMKNEVSTLEKQNQLISSSDPEGQKIRQQEYQLEEDLAKISLKRTALEKKYKDAQEETVKIMNDRTTIEYLMLANARSSEDALVREIANQHELFDDAEEGEAGKNQRLKAENNLRILNNLEFVNGKKIADDELDIMIKKLNLQFQINKATFDEKRAKDEINNIAKHTQKMTEIQLRIDILNLKRNNKNGQNDRAIIDKEREQKKEINRMEQNHQMDLRDGIRLKNEEEKKGFKARMEILEAEQSQLQKKGSKEIKRLGDIQKEMNSLTERLNKHFSENPAWLAFDRQLQELIRHAKTFAIEWNTAIDKENIKDANKEMNLLIKLIGQGAENSKRMTDEVRARQEFSQKTGISADLFGLGEFGDSSKFSKMQDQFKSFFDGFGNVEHLANLKNFNTELDAIRKERQAIIVNDQMESEERLSKEAELLKRELNLYLNFNNSFRSSISELQGLYNERFEAGMNYLDQMSQINKENEKLDIDAKYQGRNLSDKERSRQLKDNIQHNIKWIQEGHKQEMHSLEAQKGMLEDDASARLEHDRKVAVLKAQTALALKKELQTATAHNISLEDVGQNQGKNLNKLGSSVLKWRNGELERQRKYHRDVEDLENNHQTQMNEYAKQGDGSLIDKAKRMSQMQEKLYHDRKALDEDFAKSQSEAKNQLYETLKGSHTKKGGEEFELDPAIKAMIENLTALISDELGKVPKTVEKQMQEWKTGYQPEIRGEKGGWFFGIGKQTDAILQEYQAGVLDLAKMQEVSGDEMYNMAKFIQTKMGKTRWEQDFGVGTTSLGNIPKVMEMLAQLKVMGLTFEKLKEMYPDNTDEIISLEDIKKKFDEKLSKLQTEREAREKDKIKAEKAQVQRINEVNVALAGLGQGEGSKLAMFGLAIDGVTKKLGELKNSLDNPPGLPSGNGNGQQPINVTVNGMFDLQKSGRVMWNEMMKGQSENQLGSLLKNYSFDMYNGGHRDDRKTPGRQITPGSSSTTNNAGDTTQTTKITNNYYLMEY